MAKKDVKAENIELMEAAAKEIAQIPKDSVTLEALIGKSSELIKIEKQIEQAEKDLKELKAARETLRIAQLPPMFIAMSMKTIGVMIGNDERTVYIDDLITATLPKDADKRQAALDWIVDRKDGGMIKRMLLLELPKGDAKAEHLASDALKKALPGCTPIVSADIHHSTYKAYISKLVKAGVEFPKDKLGVYVAQIARITGLDEDD